MITAIVAAVGIQALLAAMLFGTARLDRAEPMAWMAQHPLVKRRQHGGDSAKALAHRQAGLERLGAATRRASSHHELRSRTDGRRADASVGETSIGQG